MSTPSDDIRRYLNILNESATLVENNAEIHESWSKKYKKSINCNNPKGFSQRAHCAGRRKRQAHKKTKSRSINESAINRLNSLVESIVYKCLERNIGLDAIEQRIMQMFETKGILTENLRKWFKQKWVRFGPDGKIRGACARGSKSEGKPKCLPQAKAHALGKKGRASAAARKRRQDPNPERRGKAKNVATKKVKEDTLNRYTPSIYELAVKHKVSLEYIRAQLQHGIAVEKEHTSNEKIAREIALDHLSENPNYYKKLKKAKLEENEEILPSVEQAKKLLPQVLERVQKTYNNWDESDIDTYAGGGICHYIADDICSVLTDHGIDCATISCSHDQHVYVAGKFLEGIYSIDIPFHIYETGGGFSWKKISGVVFEPSDVVFYKVSSDTSEWDNYISESVSFDEIQIPRQGYKVERGGYKFQLSYDGANITVNVYPRDYQYDYSMNYIAYAVLDRERNNLFPIDLAVVDDDYKGRGIAKLIYDYLKELGFTVYRGKDQTGAGKKFWDKNRGKNIKIWEISSNKVTKKMIHDLADKFGIPWDDDPTFLKMTEKLTGKKYLDDLSKQELAKVYSYLEKQLDA